MGSCQSTEAVSAGNVGAEGRPHGGTKKPLPNAGKESAKSTAANRSQASAETPGTNVIIVPLNENGGNRDYHHLGYSSGGSTPVDSDSRSLDGSSHGSVRSRANSTSGNPKALMHSSSVVGLDEMIQARKEEGDLKSNVVHFEVPFGKPIEEVYDGVHNGPVLGSGISGLVRLATHRSTGVKYAVKCLDLDLVDSPEGLQQLREEIFIMCQLDHPNIVRLEEVYESHSEIYLVQELCIGGELFDRLDEQPDYHYTEAECARLVKQMLCAVRYLHSKGIIHRDMKLENFLFSSTAPDSELKMIDFGLSKHFKFGEVLNEAVGTPYTVAPEVIRGKYDERCDIWAIGVITYLLLSGDPPFGGCGGPEPLMTVRSNILRGAFGFEPPEIWSIVSPQARDFIQKLLVTEPKLRPTAREAQKHPWLKEWASKDKKADDNMLNPNVVKALVSFKEFSDMRKLLCEVLSFTLLPDQIRELRKEFEKMDTDGSGEISLQALKNVLLTEAGAGSLGALTESEVEDIFNAMRVSKTETRIHWHEFIAAGLSQCQVDDRNLRLAFDRLDSDHKGYITFDNVKDLMGNASMESEDAMQAMWGDSMKACQCKNARITYDDFILLMKGQTKETLQQISEHKVSEGESVLILPSGEKVVVTDEGTEFPSLKKSGSGSLRRLLGVGSAPSTPLYGAAVSSQIPPEIDMPVSMDEDDDVQITPEHSKGIFNNLTPPQSPERGAYDYITPFSAPKAKSPSPDADVLGLPMPEMPKRPPPYFRKRSRSVDDQESPNMNDSQGETPAFGNDARRAVMLPEHGYQREFENLIHDETKTTLVVNRQLYRAHRQMRIAVLEATKRFEEEQTRRAREILMAQKEEESNTDPPTTPVGGAGLVLRHGLKRQVSQEAVRKFLAKSKEETDVLMQKATKRGGRGRSRRQKTNSDMSGMLAGLSAELDQAKQELGASQSEIDSFAPFTVKEGTEAIMLPGSEELDANGEPVFPPIRNATVPGVFRRTKDPFGQGGRYNASS